MRIAVEHRTRYRFSEPQARIVQLLRLTPHDTENQTVVHWMIGVDRDARLREATDGFGNAVTMLYADGPIEAIEISVSGEVLTSDASGVIRTPIEPLPPLVFLRPTARTMLTGALAEFVAEVATGGEPLDRLHRLNAALFARFPAAPDAPDRGCTAAQAFEATAVTSRDLAQMFVAGARGLGVPARYVSGYRLDGAAGCAPHAWAEAQLGGLGWVGFDPAQGISPDERYVRVAVGLDATSAAPVAGTRIGAGEERLDVNLQVEQLGREG